MGMVLTQPNSRSSSIYENVSAHPECLISFSAVRKASSPMTSCEIPPPCRDVDGGAVEEGLSEPGAMGMGVLWFIDGLMAALPALVTSNN